MGLDGGDAQVKTNDTELIRLFQQAEHGRTCLTPPNQRLREALRRRVERGEVIRPARGMYARAPYWNALTRPQQTLCILRTLQSQHPTWTFCHESAAVVFGLPVSYRRLDSVCVATSRANRNPRSGSIRWHIVEGDEPVTVQGLRVTSLQRTAFDCMRTVDFGQALAIADGALRVSGCSASSFISHFRRIGGSHTGKAHAMRTMRYADALSESGGESIARAAMIQQGFALPELQVAFPQPLHRGRTYRVDFLWTRLDGSKVIGEFDGMQKYEDETMLKGRSMLRSLVDERHREAQLTLYGMPIVRLSYNDVVHANRFTKLLRQYGIPQSDEVARFVRRAARSRSTAAQIFTVCNLAG